MILPIYSCLNTYCMELWVSLESRVNKIEKLNHQRLGILHFRTKLLLQLVNLESRKEKKGAPRKEHFILLLLLFFSYLSDRSRPSGDQTSTFSGPGHFLISTGNRATVKF